MQDHTLAAINVTGSYAQVIGISLCFSSKYVLLIVKWTTYAFLRLCTVKACFHIHIWHIHRNCLLSMS